MSEETKAVVTVSEMARMCGLSRARFYQLQKDGIFPPPLYDVKTRRPIYDEELQKVCLEVRRRNCGVNGKPILFYARRVPLATPSSKPKKATASKPKNDEWARVVEDVELLLRRKATPAELESAVKEVFPQGTAGVDHTEVVRAIFVRIQRKN